MSRRGRKVQLDVSKLSPSVKRSIEEADRKDRERRREARRRLEAAAGETGEPRGPEKVATGEAFPLAFSVPGPPVPQPRPRTFVDPETGETKTVSCPASHPINQYRKQVCETARIAMRGRLPMGGPLSLRLVFVFPRRVRDVRKTKPMVRIPHAVRSDATNLAKGVEDALDRVVWGDDGQVCRLSVEKWYAAGDEGPHTEIEVSSAL